MTQSDLARLIGYKNPNFIAIIEKDGSKFPIRSWVKFADALVIPRHQFLKVAIRQAYPEMMDYISFKPPRVIN